MRRRSSVLSALGMAAVLAAPLACSNSEEGEAKTEAKSAETPTEAKTEAKTEGAPAKPDAEAQGGLAQSIAKEVDAITPGEGRLSRGDALVHIVMPKPSALLEKVRTKAAPPSGAAFLNEAGLRAMAGMVLGPRSGLAQHLSLDQPLGCVLIDDTVTDVPVACTMGYTGGAKAAITDLGSEGKQPDAEGHLAHYLVGGQDLYLDEVDGSLVVTNHASILAKAKSYLATNIIGRAEAITDDVEMVVYPKAAMTRYSEQIDTLMSAMNVASAPTGEPFLDVMAEYSKTSTERSFDYYRGIDQFEMGMGLQEVGFVFRYAMFPTPGSSTQSDTQAVATGPMDVSLVEQLPAESWLVSGSTVDWKAAWSLEGVVPMREMLLDAYATAIGRVPTDVRASVDAFLEENASLYEDDMAIAVAHLPGTQGGLVVSRKLAAPARATWQPWTEGFVADKVLGSKGSEVVTWSFQADALNVDGVAVDRWIIEPGPKAKAEIAASKDLVVAEIERRFGGLRLVIDRVELSDRVLFVVAPGSQQSYIRAAIDATKSGGTGSDAGLTALLARNPETSAIMALDVAGALSWAREVLPPEATRELPAGLGKDLGDFYFSATYNESGEQHGEMVLSQSMIDGLRTLAK